MTEASMMSSTSATERGGNGTDSSAQMLAFAVAALQHGAPSIVSASSARQESAPPSTAFPTTILPGTSRNSNKSSLSSTLPSKDFGENEKTQSAGSGSGENPKTSFAPDPLPAKSVSPLEFSTPLLSSYLKPENTEDTAAIRLQRSRERNREHARRTRLRKKAHLENLQSKCKGLQAERQALQQQLEDRSIASILLGLSSSSKEDGNNNNDTPLDTLSLLQRNTDPAFPLPKSPAKRRKRGEAAPRGTVIRVILDGNLTEISCKSHINWKTGVFSDEQGRQKKLSPEQLETLRRERNRMHAKMTRDRKKCFIASMEKTIEELEHDITNMRALLKQLEPLPQQTAMTSTTDIHHQVTPLTSPELSAVQSPDDMSQHDIMEPHPAKRVRHGFSLDD